MLGHEAGGFDTHANAQRRALPRGNSFLNRDYDARDDTNHTQSMCWFMTGLMNARPP